MQHWVKELRKIVGPEIKICIAGNKSDMESQRQISAKDAEKYAKEIGAIYCETSAKSGAGVEQAFLELTKLMLKDHKKSQNQRKSTRNNRGDVVGIAEYKEKPTSGCC